MLIQLHKLMTLSSSIFHCESNWAFKLLKNQYKFIISYHIYINVVHFLDAMIVWFLSLFFACFVWFWFGFSTTSASLANDLCYAAQFVAGNIWNQSYLRNKTQKFTIKGKSYGRIFRVLTAYIFQESRKYSDQSIMVFFAEIIDNSPNSRFFRRL